MVIGSEGCVSARTGPDSFGVKVHGGRLATLSRRDIVQCRLKEAAMLIDLQFLRPFELTVELAKARISPDEGVPAIDSCAHAWLLQQPEVRFVAQAHPITCLQVLCSPAADKFAENRMFPDEIIQTGGRSAFVPFSDPGVALAREIRSKVTLHARQNYGRMPKVILVQNYGVLTLGNTPDEVFSSMQMTSKAAEVLTGTARMGGVVFIPTPVVRRLVSELGVEPDHPRVAK